MITLLQSAFEKRSSLFDVTDAYRVVNGAADGFPGLTLDRFGDRFQVQFFGPEMLPRCRERGCREQDWNQWTGNSGKALWDSVLCVRAQFHH